MAVDPRLGETADRQYGLITVRQLRSLGISEDRRRRLLVAGMLRPVRRSVYRLMGVPPCWEQSVLAAVLAAGPDAVASYATAGAIWGLKHCWRSAGAESRLHVTAPRQLRMDGVMGHIALIDRRQRRIHRGIPVTSPEQTVVDLGAALAARELGECVDDALRRGLIRLAQVHDPAETTGGPGRSPATLLHRVLADRIPGYDPGDSDWERQMDRCWEEWGLPPAVRQHRVRVKGRTYILDRAIPALKIGVEWNGFDTHGTRSRFDHDSDRRADLTGDGWHMVDFTSRSSKERICQAVLAAVSQRQALGWVS